MIGQPAGQSMRVRTLVIPPEGLKLALVVASCWLIVVRTLVIPPEGLKLALRLLTARRNSVRTLVIPPEGLKLGQTNSRHKPI